MAEATGFRSYDPRFASIGTQGGAKIKELPSSQLFCNSYWTSLEENIRELLCVRVCVRACEREISEEVERAQKVGHIDFILGPGDKSLGMVQAS